MKFKHTHFFLTPIFLLSGFILIAQENYSLQETLRTAKDHNPNLKTARYNISVSETEIISAKLRPNPSLHNESLQLIKSAEFAGNTDWYHGENRELFWEVSKPIQIAGKRKHKITLAKKNVNLAEKDYAETERNLFLNVAEKWLDVWVAQKQLDLIESAKSNIDSLLYTNKRRYKNQVITQTELYRTELLKKQYAIQYKTATQQVENEQEKLGFLLGKEKNPRIDTSANFLKTIPYKLEFLIKEALEERSDIKSARSLIEVSTHDINLQKSLAYPQPEIGVIYNPQGKVPFLGITFTVDLPFFDRNQGEIQKSRQLQAQAEQQLVSAEKQLKTEVAVAYSNYMLQQKNKDDFKELLDQSKTILNNVKHAYLKGGTTIIDFLEAQRSWLETQQQYYDTLQNYRQSYIQILYATGLINQLAI